LTAGAVRLVESEALAAVPPALAVTEIRFFMASPFVPY